MSENERTIYAVTAIIRNEHGQTLLLKRNESSYHNYWQFPEGKIDKGETELAAIKRELNEEIGADSLKLTRLGRHACPFMFHGISVTLDRMIYKTSKPKKITLSDEHSEYGWFSSKDLDFIKLIPGVKDIVAQYIVEREM